MLPSLAIYQFAFNTCFVRSSSSDRTNITILYSFCIISDCCNSRVLEAWNVVVIVRLCGVSSVGRGDGESKQNKCDLHDDECKLRLKLCYWDWIGWDSNCEFNIAFCGFIVGRVSVKLACEGLWGPASGGCPVSRSIRATGHHGPTRSTIDNRRRRENWQPSR